MARKYELETIPIWDALDAESECPLCLLDEQAEQRYVQFFLGNSVMIPEMRVEVNKTGFCRPHFQALWEGAANRHSLSLIAHTHLKDIMEHANRHEKRSMKRRGGGVEGYIDYLRKRDSSCMICDRMEYTRKRYAFTIIHLWGHKEEFRRAISASRGFCYFHLASVLEMGVEQLSKSKIEELASELIRLQQKEMGRIEEELLWYTQKFDFQNDDKPWGTSKDALHRALQKITGLIYRDRS